MAVIELPNGDELEVPDDFTPDQMRQAVQAFTKAQAPAAPAAVASPAPAAPAAVAAPAPVAPAAVAAPAPVVPVADPAPTSAPERFSAISEVKQITRDAAGKYAQAVIDVGDAAGNIILSPIREAAAAAGYDIGPGLRESVSQFVRGTLSGYEASGDLAPPVPLFRVGAAAIYDALPEEKRTPEAWAAAKMTADVFSIMTPLFAPRVQSAAKLGNPDLHAVPKKAAPVSVAVAEGNVPPPVSAPALSPSQVLSPPALPPAKAGNINLNRINAPDAVKGALFNISERYASELDDATRGVITHDATKEAARAMGMTVDELLSRRVGQAFNAEQALAARDLLVETTQHLVAAAKKAGPGNYDEFATAMARHLAVQEQVAGATAEAGRALQAFRIMSDSGRRAQAIQAAIKAAGGPGKIDDIAAKLADLGDDPAAAAKFIRDAQVATTGDKLYFAWINAILSAPSTHVANITGNVASNTLNLIESGIAEGIGRVTGRGHVAGETLARASGTIRGLLDGLAAGAKAQLHGSTIPGQLEIRAEPIAALRGKAGAWLPTRSLTAQDIVFRTAAYRGELGAQAIRQAATEGLRGPAAQGRITELLANPTLDMKNAAEAAAQYATFTKDLGRFGKQFQKLVASDPTGISRYLVPFIRTPANLLKYAGERSPLAPLSPTIRRALMGADGPVAQQDAIARLVTGSAITTAAVVLFNEGKITAAGPSDPGERRLWLESNQPYSIRVGDQWVSYQRLEPISTLFGVTAGLTEAWQREGASDDEIKKTAGAVIEGIAENLSNKTFLSGTFNAVQAIMEPERYGERYLARQATSIVPNVVRRSAQALSPEFPDSRTILQEFQASLPGLRDDLPKRRTIFGEAFGSETGPLETFFSPFYRKDATPNEVAGELLRLGYAPGPPSRYTTRKGKRIDYSPQQYETYATIAGQETYRIFNETIGSEEYRGMTDEDRIDALKRQRDRINRAARDRLREVYPDLDVD